MNFYRRLRYLVVQELGSRILSIIPDFFFRFTPLPKFMIIEATNSCNLRCPLCPTNTTETRLKGLMDLEPYKRLIDELAGTVKSIAFNACGEPTLNPRLFKMVAYAKQKGIETMISTNTTTLGRFINQVFESGLPRIIVCLDGATKKTHEGYRVGSDFRVVVENISDLVKEKRRRKFTLPVIQLQFVVMKQNEKELPKLIRLAKKLGVDELSIKTVSLGQPGSVAEKLARAQKFLPIHNRFRRYDKKGSRLMIKNNTKLCNWAQRGFVYWNGEAGSCCYDFNGMMSIGNAFTDGGFKKVWRSARFAKIHKKILLRQLPICNGCNATSDYGTVLSRSQLEKLPPGWFG